MNKRNKIIYWVFTIWMALGMTSTGIVQLIQMEDEVARMARLGFPAYLLLFLGISKLLGIVVVLMPRLPILKEWAYAGFFFTLAGALYAHIMSADPFGEIFPAILLLAITSMSYFFRPADRKLA